MNQAASHLRAVLYALAGFTLWVLSDTALKLVGESAVPKYELMTVSSIGGMIIIAGFTMARGNIEKLRPNGWKGLLILGLLHLTNFSLWIVALPHLPLANLYAVAFLSPIMVSILAAVVLREHITWKHAIAIIAGFAGVIIAINPEQLMQHSNKSMAYGFALASTVLLSVMMVILRILGRSETRECMAFYPRTVILTGTIIAGLFNGFVHMKTGAIIYVLMSGAAGSLGWLLMAHAYKLAPAAIVAPFHYSEIVTGALIGYLVWHDIPALHVVIGAAIIIVSGIYIITHTHKASRILREEEHV